MLCRWTAKEILDAKWCPGCGCEVTSSKCFGCDAFTPFIYNQQLECEKYFGSIKNSKIYIELKLVKRNLVEHTYSLRFTLIFINEKEEYLTNHLYTSTIFENSINFEELCELKVGDKNTFAVG